jgi:uncharacterized protein YtpQ (UPF0354 family)
MPKHLCAAVFLFSVALCCSARAQDVPKGKGAFTEYVAAQLRRELRDAQVAVKGPLTVTVGELQANLDRIFAYCSENTEGCRREISTYVKGVVQTQKDRLAPPSKESVRILVRTREYVEGAALQKVVLQSRDLTGGLVMLPAIDTPRTLKPLIDKDYEKLGLSADEVFKLGLANLRKHLKPLMQVARVTQPGQIGSFTGDVYHSSRLALHDSWAPLAQAQGGKLIVAVPATDTVLYIGDDSPLGIDALRALVKKISPRFPNPLSTELFRWNPTGWEVVR